jgi:hypothetical protein
VKKYFLIFLVFCYSCIRPEKPPEDVIPRDTMAAILVDIHIAESKVSVKSIRPDSAHIYYNLHKKEIFNKYKVPEERFEKSFEYYMRNLTEMDQIYAVVVDSLSLREGRGKID